MASNFKYVVVIFTLFVAEVLTNCFIEQSHFCHCGQYSVNCSSLDVPLDAVLPNLIPHHTKFLILKKSWTDTPTTILQYYHISIFHNLQLFDVSGNRIISIEPETFSDFPRLRVINLSNNWLRFLEANTFSGNLPCLEVLDLSNNRLLLLLDLTFTAAPALRHLDLRNNTLFYAGKDAFLGLNNLENLQLQRCNSTLFPSPSLNSLRSLLEFKAQKFDHVSCLPAHAFRNNHKMKVLHLEDFHRLTYREIHNHAFVGLSNLHNLTLAGCNLTSVPARALSVLKGLTKLDLSRNPIKSIGTYDFTKLVKLKVLILQKSSLQNIMPGAFSSFVGLRILDLSENRLTSLRRNVFPNKLSSFKIKVWLHNNQWYCDCFVTWLLSSRSIMVSDALKATCTGPQDIQGQNFVTLSNLHLNCAKTKTFAKILPVRNEQDSTCSWLDDLSSFVEMSLKTDSTMSLNYTRLDNQSPIIVIRVNDITGDDVVLRRCYKFRSAEVNGGFPALRSVSVQKKEDVAMLAPIILGVLVMLSCLGFLACIAMTAWGCQLKKDNEKLKAQLRTIFEKKQIISRQNL